MIEFKEIEREFKELEENDDWEETFRVNFFSLLKFSFHEQKYSFHIHWKFNLSAGDSTIKKTVDNARHSSNEKYNRYSNILPCNEIHSFTSLITYSD